MNNKRPLLGFAILSHKQPAQLLRLIHTLSAMFDDPPISIHHDFSQCELDREDFPPHARFITPAKSTKWGDWSLVEAAMAAIKHLFDRGDYPEWLVLLSGNDYPIQKPDKISSFYEN